MKISRRDLRKIILESILSEQESKTASAGARKLARGEDLTPADIRKNIEDDVRKVVDNFVGDEAFNAKIHVGRLSIKVRRPQGNVDVRKLEKALKDGVDDKELRSALRPGRNVIVVYDKVAGSSAPKVSSSEAAETAEDETSTSTTSAGIAASTEERSREEGIYRLPGDNTYVYRVSSKGHWETQKKGGSTWFSLKGNQAAMNKLDRAHPSARSEEFKEKITATLPALGSFLKFKGTIYRYDTYAGHNEYWKGKGYTNITNLGNQRNNNKETALVSWSPNDSLMFIGFNGLQMVVKDKTKNWVMPSGQAQTPDYYKKMTNLYNDILENGVKTNEPSELSALSESLSRGALIRKRYWGRY